MPSIWRIAALDLSYSGALVTIMNIIDLTPQQLRRAASIKERLDGLDKELRRLLDGAMINRATTKKRTLSAAARRKIAAAQRARWAKLRRAKA